MIVKRSQKGIAMIAALGFMIITVAFIGTLLTVNVSNKRLTAYNIQTIQTQLAAEAGIDQAVFALWHVASKSIEADKPLGQKSVEDYRRYWDTLDPPLKAAVTEDEDQTPIFGDPVSITGDLGNGTSYQVEVSRKDIGAKSTLRMVATSHLGNESTRRLSQNFSVEFPPFELDFALLTDMVNCTFCHAAFISMESGYSFEHGDSSTDYMVNIANETNRQNAATGTERVRVASLTQLMAEPGVTGDADGQKIRANTLVGGTIYTRGEQNIISPCDGGFGCKDGVFGPSYQTSDGEALPIIANEPYQEFGNKPRHPIEGFEETLVCSKSEKDGNKGCEKANARGYVNYPKAKKGQIAPIDGVVPDVALFPSPVFDTDGNRYIDNEEWSAAVGSTSLGKIDGAARLLLSPTDSDGNVQSGSSDQFTFSKVTASPIDDLKSYTSLIPSSSRGIEGNLILIGTDTNPIRLTGRVYIDGDLVMAGYIDPGKDGVLVVRRNLYIVGDLLYDCNGGSFGRDCVYYDSDKPLAQPRNLPRLAMAAAGVVVIGDYSYVSPVNGGLPGAFKDPGEFTNSAVFAEIMNFNQTQLSKKPPRFYSWQYRDSYVSDGENLPVCRDTAGECRGYYIPGHSSGIVKQQGPLTTDEIDSAAGGDAIIPLSPYKHWLAPKAIRDANDLSIPEQEKITATTAQNMIRDLWAEFIQNNHNGRPSGAVPKSSDDRQALRIDGLIYSNNAVFAFLPTALETHGSLIINGSIIAYETGLLIYSNADHNSSCDYGQTNLFSSNQPDCIGLRVHYDRRLPALLDLRDTGPQLHSLSFEWQSLD